MTAVYAVVPSAGRECLRGCLDSLLSQVDLLFLVQAPKFYIRSDPKLVCLPWDSSRERNISEWWNMGIKAAAMTAKYGGMAKWDVLITNDDIIAASNLVAALSTALRSGQVDASDPWRDPHPRGLSVRPGQADLAYPYRAERNGHIFGSCFMIRGESGIMGDEQFHWWYGDNDMEYQASVRGGVALSRYGEVAHLHPGGNDQAMAARIPVDRELFQQKWWDVP